MTHSATVRVAGHEFTAYYTRSDDLVKVDGVFFSEYPDNVIALLKPVIVNAIAIECAKAHRVEAEYIGRREDMERLES